MRLTQLLTICINLDERSNLSLPCESGCIIFCETIVRNELVVSTSNAINRWLTGCDSIDYKTKSLRQLTKASILALFRHYNSMYTFSQRLGNYKYPSPIRPHQGLTNIFAIINDYNSRTWWTRALKRGSFIIGHSPRLNIAHLTTDSVLHLIN
ncbi:hypothetical protein C4K29_3801 [Pseudomonas chlororaphis subsp. piscium]|nr:hypothetical protein C4K29_3801 [Pseudomonas chlororaphis subsp. piscium]